MVWCREWRNPSGVLSWYPITLPHTCCMSLSHSWHHFWSFHIASLVLKCVFVRSMHLDTAGWGLSCWGRQHVSTIQCCCSHTPCSCRSRPALQFHWSSWSSSNQSGRCRIHCCRSLQGLSVLFLDLDCTVQHPYHSTIALQFHQSWWSSSSQRNVKLGSVQLCHCS